MRFILLLSVIPFMLSSCEKFSDYDGDGDTEQNGGNGNGVGNTGDGGEENGGSDNGETSLGDLVDVETFCNTPIYTQVWVKGYIVGAATGASGKTRYEFVQPFSYNTAILLADAPAAGEDDTVMSVCLTTCSKKIRELLNLVDHPENHGKLLEVFGFQDTYLKLTGIKHIDAYKFPAE